MMMIKIHVLHTLIRHNLVFMTSCNGLSKIAQLLRLKPNHFILWSSQFQMPTGSGTCIEMSIVVQHSTFRTPSAPQGTCCRALGPKVHSGRKLPLSWRRGEKHESPPFANWHQLWNTHHVAVPRVTGNSPHATVTFPVLTHLTDGCLPRRRRRVGQAPFKSVVRDSHSYWLWHIRLRGSLKRTCVSQKL